MSRVSKSFDSASLTLLGGYLPLTVVASIDSFQRAEQAKAFTFSQLPALQGVTVRFGPCRRALSPPRRVTQELSHCPAFFDWHYSRFLHVRMRLPQVPQK
jgi:hypothetical protein